MKRSIENYKRDVEKLAARILRDHGQTAVQRLFGKAVPSKSGIKADKNLLILADCIRSGLPAQQYAAMLAKKKNTNPYSEERQIGRLKKRYPLQFKYLKWAWAVMQEKDTF